MPRRRSFTNDRQSRAHRFLATGAAPCLAESQCQKSLRRIHEKGFEIIGVSFDNNIETMKKFIAVNEIRGRNTVMAAAGESAINKDFAIKRHPHHVSRGQKGALREPTLALASPTKSAPC
jgi:hypothetical protein